MINPRVYRAAFVPALLALIALLLSVNTAPPALQPPPSGVGTDAIGDVPRPRGEAGGAPMPNTVVTLPGESERTIAVIAVPSGEDSGDPATRALSELASAFQSARHSKTLLLASTEAGAGGAEARDLLLSHPAADRVEAVVTLSGASGDDEAEPEVLSDSAGPQSTSAQLVETARGAVRSETGRPLEVPGPLGSFLNLAFPSGEGPQAELIEDGMDAVGLEAGSAGELNVVAFQLVTALDPAPAAPVHGPAAWIPLSGNLIPGWAFALLALTLLLPSALAGIDALARTRRIPLSTPRDAIPPLVGLAAVIAVVGIWLANPFLALLCVPVAHVWVVWPVR